MNASIYTTVALIGLVMLGSIVLAIVLSVRRGGNQEIGPAADSFDELREQLRRQDSDLQQRTAELEALNKELAAFSHSVSHDLRAPIRTIDGFSEALAEEYRDKLGDQGLEYLKRIRAAAARMDVLINGLLELSRVSREELRREKVDLSMIAESIAMQLKEGDPARTVRFAIQPGLAVEGDPRLLKTALEHLLGNAWKFTRKHSVATIEVGSEQPDGHRLLFVRDDGAGFDPIYAGKMFGAFQRFHTTAEFEGTGIGLAMVQRIVHRHGGTVWAVGKVEAGTTVYIDLE
jgi:light-regulated signal transduction histidine kinase (bacteriophytochrome)